MLEERCSLIAAHSSSLWPHTRLSVHLILSQAFPLFQRPCCSAVLKLSAMIYHRSRSSFSGV